MSYQTMRHSDELAVANSATTLTRAQPRIKMGPASGKVLCIDDDADLTDLLQYALTREGFTVHVANTPEQAHAAVKSDPPDLILLDVNLPARVGFDLCLHFRTMWHIPVILVTALRTEEDEVSAFEYGADGYITKPFTMKVLVQRVRAVLRSTQATPVNRTAERPMHRLGPALFNASFNEIMGNGRSARLTPMEGKILQVLLMCEGQVVSAERIMSRVMRYDSETSVNVVKTHIRNLRIKIATVMGDVEVIRTVPGSGYMLRLPVTEATDLRQA